MDESPFNFSYRQIVDDPLPDDAPPVYVNPDDLPTTYTTAGHQDYRRFLDSETVLGLHHSANSGAGTDVIETLDADTAPQSNSGALVVIALAALLLLSSR